MKKLTTLLALLTVLTTYGQQKRPDVSLLFGLNQPIVLHGFNFEANVWMKKFVIDYSHGFNLKFHDNLVTTEAHDQHLAFKVTNTLGVGLGYRFTEAFNLRLEPKVHVWEMYYDDEFGSANGRIKKYNTYTLGLGAYYRWMPFRKSENALRGLTIAPSVRWWPNVGSSLKGNQYEYYNARTMKNEVHQANNIGISNTAWFANVSVGWTL